jgi:hypothetical protein
MMQTEAPMNDLVIELILIATFVVPLVLSSIEPARAVSRPRACLFGKLRRTR